MRKSIVLVAFTLVAMLTGAQTIKSHKASVDDYISLLNNVGYNAYCFTLPQEFVGHSASFAVKEYRDGKELSAEESPMSQVLEGLTFGIDSPEVMIGLTPEQKGDSARMICMNWGARISISFPYVFKITDETSFDTDGNRAPYYFYSMVENDEELVVKQEEFVPLCLFGSAYKIVQGDYTYYKFCGSFKDLEESSPHYYLIGIKIH